MAPNKAASAITHSTAPPARCTFAAASSRKPPRKRLQSHRLIVLVVPLPRMMMSRCWGIMARRSHCAPPSFSGVYGVMHTARMRESIFRSNGSEYALLLLRWRMFLSENRYPPSPSQGHAFPEHALRILRPLVISALFRLPQAEHRAGRVGDDAEPTGARNLGDIP